MRLLAPLLVATFLLAGCAGTPPAPATPEDDAADVPSGVPDVASSVSANASGAQVTSYRLDLANLTYADQLLRYTLTLLEDAQVNVTFQVRMGMYANADDCAASAAHAFLPSGGAALADPAPGADDAGNGTAGGNATAGGNGTASAPGGDGVPFGASVVAWAWKNSLAMRAAGPGFDETVDPAPEDQSGQLPNEVDGAFGARLPAGTRIVLEMGGHSTRFAHSRFQDPDQPSVFKANENRLTVDVAGDAVLAADGTRALRCGEGPAQAGGHAGFAQASVVQASSGGRIALDGANGGTLLTVEGTLLQTPREATARFGPQAFAAGDVRRTSGEPTKMSLEFGTWVGVYPSYYWLLADTHWPALQET